MKITQDQNLSPIHSNVTVNQLWFAMNLIRDLPKINWFATTIFRDHYPHSFWYDNQTAKTSWWQEIFAMKRISQILRIFLAHLWKLVYSMFHDKTEYHSTIAWQNLPLRVLSWWLFEPSCSWRVPRCLSSPRLPNIAGAPTGSTMPIIWKSKLKKSQVMDN